MTTSDERPDVTAADPAPTARTLEARAEAFGRETEAAFGRLAKSPVVEETVDIGSRIWGLILLAVGVWFLADVTLDIDLPAVAWRDLWPVALIAIGLVVVLRGARRRA